jgi:putative CRISPR-associated protein (TIGR02619 family)
MENATRTIVTTVGTSLLTSAGRAPEDAPPPLDDLIRLLRDTPPSQASAETNSLSRLASPGDRIVLLHSDTPEGKLCAEALHRHLRLAGHDTETRLVKDLSYEESRFKFLGLRSLVGTLVEVVGTERRRGRDVRLNATGGFKAEAGYVTLVGLLLGAPVYYIHERFDDIVEMPAIPVSWNLALVAEHESFFSWIDEEPRAREAVEERIRRDGIPAAVRLLLVEDDGCLMLSAAGEACYAVLRAAVEEGSATPLLLSEKARRQFDGFDKTTQESFRRVFERLRSKRLREAGCEKIARCDGLIYPQGHTPCRAFFVESDDGAIHVLELSLHGRDYDRLIDRGVRLQDYAGFEAF